MHKNKFLRNNKIKDSPCVREKKVAVKYQKRINKRLTINQKCLPKASWISLDSIPHFFGFYQTLPSYWSQGKRPIISLFEYQARAPPARRSPDARSPPDVQLSVLVTSLIDSDGLRVLHASCGFKDVKTWIFLIYKNRVF